MANYINTINIPAQATATAMITEIINALVTALDWVADEDGLRVWTDSQKNMGIKFWVNGSNVNACLSNGIPSVSINPLSLYFASNACVDYISSPDGYSLGLGFRNNTNVISLQFVFAKNTENSLIGFQFFSNQLYQLKRTDSIVFAVDLPKNTAAGKATAICKMPDVTSGVMFRDLYFVFSCPATSSDLVIYIGGRFYRICCYNTNYNRFAIPVS